jgi:DNA-binding LytR/AlgR family response regulator
MAKISCIAVDDEPLALQNMKKYISQMDSLNLLEVFTRPLEALKFLNDNHVDLIFLDIEMDTLNGLQLIETLTYKPKIVLTTAYDKYALKGYDHDVVDYLLKPFSFERFVKSVNKVTLSLSAHSSLFSLPEENFTDNFSENFLFVRTNYHMEKILLDDIRYIKSMNNYLIIKTEEKSFFTLSSFKQIQSLLNPKKFFRIHKSYLISIDKTDIIQKNSVRIGNSTIPIGESFKKDFFDNLEKNRMA